MSEGTRVVLVNIGIAAGLIWCYFRGGPPRIIIGCGIVLFVFANVLMYFKRRKNSN
jgi:hypothetical protein